MSFFKQEFKLQDFSIGIGKPCFIAAEIGVNFNGSMELAKQSIDEAAKAGANAVKFQTFKAEEFVAHKDLTYTYKNSKGKTITESQYDMFKRLELPDDWHSILKKYAESKGVSFFSSAADRNAVDLLVKMGVPALKMASEDLINVELLEYVAQQKIPVILSTGMSNQEEVDEAVEIFKKHKHDKIIILHCVSSYPTPNEYSNLKKIHSLATRYQVPVGFSDHTEGPAASVLAVALGACVIEKHFTVDKNLPGPDHKMSMDPTEFTQMVSAIRAAESMMGDGKITFQKVEEEIRRTCRRSIVAAQDIASGTKITAEMLAYKRPGDGLKPTNRTKLIGKKTVKAISKNEKINLEDIS